MTQAKGYSGRDAPDPSPHIRPERFPDVPAFVITEVTENGELQCLECDMRFKNMRLLKEHRRSHPATHRLPDAGHGRSRSQPTETRVDTDFHGPSSSSSPTATPSPSFLPGPAPAVLSLDSESDSDEEQHCAKRARTSGSGKFAEDGLVGQSLRVMVNNAQFSDVVFIVGGHSSADIHPTGSGSGASSCPTPSPTESDAEESGGSQRFYASATILAARSPVFRPLLFGHMKEAQNKSDPIRVPDCKPEGFLLLLEFIYTNVTDLPDDPHAVVATLYAAKKYQVRRLRNLCVAWITSHVQRVASSDSANRIAMQYLELVENSTPDEDHLRRWLWCIIDRHVASIFHRNAQLPASPRLMQRLARRPTLRITELALFRGCVAWARKRSSSMKTAKIRDLFDFANLIDFTQMSALELADNVVPTGIFSPEELVQYFVEIARRSDNQDLSLQSNGKSDPPPVDVARCTRHQRWVSDLTFPKLFAASEVGDILPGVLWIPRNDQVGKRGRWDTGSIMRKDSERGLLVHFNSDPPGSRCCQWIADMYRFDFSGDKFGTEYPLEHSNETIRLQFELTEVPNSIRGIVKNRQAFRDIAGNLRQQLEIKLSRRITKILLHINRNGRKVALDEESTADEEHLEEGSQIFVTLLPKLNAGVEEEEEDDRGSILPIPTNKHQ